MTRTGTLCSMIGFVLTPGLSVAGARAAQPSPEPAAVAPNRTESAGDSSRAKREEQFRKMLTDAVLEGVWQMTQEKGLHGDAPLSEPKTDRYTIATVVKVGGDRWIVNARIEYADTKVTVPIPVRVVWADDTPMITIDSLPVPLIGSYSARVIFHKGFYSGIWYSSAKNYGGVLSGRIVKKAATEKSTPTTAPPKK